MKRTDTNTVLEWVVSILFQVGIVMLLFLFTGSIVNIVFDFGVTVQEVFGFGLLMWSKCSGHGYYIDSKSFMCMSILY